MFLICLKLFVVCAVVMSSINLILHVDDIES